MYKQIIIIVGMIIFFTYSTYAVNIFNGPESVTFDTIQNRYLVSNAFSGSIVEIDSNGNTSYYQTGYTNCLGNCISNNVFYFTTGDTKTIHGFDLIADTAVFFMRILTANHIDGITSDTLGNLYIVDNKLNSTSIIKVNTSDTSNITIASGLHASGQDIIYDEINNRLLVCYSAQDAPITSVDLVDYSVLDLLVFPYGLPDGITIDADANIYIGTYGSECLYKYDSTFANAPEVLSCDLGWVAGLDYNIQDDILVCPQVGRDKVTFLEYKYKASCDTTIGTTSLNINFIGESDYDVVSWYWDFSDGNSSENQSPSHTYTDPGVYSASLKLVTAENDTLFRRINNIIVYADTLIADTTYGEAGQSEPLVINGNNSAPIDEIIIPIEYSGSLPLIFDSISTAGCRTDYFEMITIVHHDLFNKKLTVKLQTSSDASLPHLQPGTGALAKIYFSYHAAASPAHNATIYLDGYDIYFATYTGLERMYSIESLNGYMTVLTPPCCLNFRGNIDNDSSDIVDISDLVYLVDFMFTSGPAPLCLEEANVDGDVGNIIDISDLVYLVDFMFTGGPAPALCP